MTTIPCPNCGQIHEGLCPPKLSTLQEFEKAFLHKGYANPKPKPIIPIGWLCPRCGRGNAPWKGQCDCLSNRIPDRQPMVYNPNNIPKQ